MEILKNILLFVCVYVASVWIITVVDPHNDFVIFLGIFLSVLIVYVWKKVSRRYAL